jgi:DNA repair protein RadA/Sms
VAIDSIQAIHDPSVGSGAGSVSQVRECAARLVNEAKSRGVTVVMVGHVTKDGSLAGPRVLEHLVDTVLTFEGDRHHSLRLLRTVKHRFGSTNELGLFEMGERGLLPVADPSKLFLADRRGNVPGSVVVPAVDGNRSLLVEVQGLVATSSASPRRAVQGLDSGRFPMIVAVLQQRVGVKLAERDVYALVVGGVRVTEPAADLAICLAISSSALAVPVPTDLVVIGEVGLGGEVRQVTHFERRIMEAARLGFERAVVPYSSPPGPPGLDIELIRVRSVCDALDAVFLGTSASV